MSNSTLRQEIQDTAISKLKSSNGTVVIPFRVGKTLIGLNLSKNYKNVLVGYPNNPIKQSWLDDSEKFNISINNITFSTYVSFHKLDLSQYDLIILDEIDQVSVKVWSQIVSSQVQKLNGLTATPPNRGDKLFFYSRYCPTLYEVSIEETAGVINRDYEIFVHMVKPSEIGGFSESKKIKWLEAKYRATQNFKAMLALMRAIGNSESKILKLKQLIVRNDEKKLVFVNTTAQADDMTPYSYHSKNKFSEENLKAFQDNETNILSSVGQLKAGVSFPNVEEAYILHTYASASTAPQKIGRALMLMNHDVPAKIHVICLRGTRDEDWVNQSLSYFDKNKITHIY